MARPRGKAGRRGHAPDPEGTAAGEDRWLQELAEIARDPSRWPALDEDSLLLLVFQQCLFYAHTQDAAAASALAELYPHVSARVGEHERLELLDRVTAAVEEGGTPVLALLPFLQHESDPAAVALAGSAFATLAALEGGDELSGPRALVRLVEHAEDEGTRAGLVGAVLQLGDRRVLPLAREGWRLLAPEGRVRLATLRSPSRLVFAAVVEFWLDAMEDAADASFAAAAGALARLPAEAEPPRVLDVRRKFPANAPDDRDEIEIVSDVTIAVFAERIEPRLRDLARRENAPPHVPAVLAAWGLPERVEG